MEEARQHPAVISPLAIIALLGGATFGWQVWRALRTGEVRLPLELLNLDRHDRAQTLFGGIVGLNVILCVAFLTLFFVAFSKGW